MTVIQARTVSFIERLASDLNEKHLELAAFPDSVIRIRQAIRDEDIGPDEALSR